MAENSPEKAQLKHSADEISVRELVNKSRDWFHYLMSKWMVILLAGIIGGIAGYFFVSLSNPIYTAETTFVLEEDNGSSGVMGQLGGLAGMAGLDIGSGGGGLFQGENIIHLYKSRSMIQKTLLSKIIHNNSDKLLIDYYIDFKGLKKNWAKDPKMANIVFSAKDSSRSDRTRDSILSSIVDNIRNDVLSVEKPDKKLSIIKVEVKSENEFFAKSFNDQIVENVNDFYVQTKTKKAIENLAILQHQTDSVRNVLNGAIYSSVAVEDATPNLNRARQILRAPAMRSQFNAEANKAILSHLVQNLELAKLSLRKETPLIQVVDTPVYPLRKDAISKIKGIAGGIFILMTGIIVILIIRRLLSNAF